MKAKTDLLYEREIRDLKRQISLLETQKAKIERKLKIALTTMQIIKETNTHGY